jgi:hypothetical protein
MGVRRRRSPRLSTCVGAVALLAASAAVFAASSARALPHFSNPWRTVALPARGYAAAVVPEPDGPGRRLLVVDARLTLHSFELRDDGALRFLRSEDLDASVHEWGLVTSGAPLIVMDVTGDDEPDLVVRSYSTFLIAPGEGGGAYGELRVYALPADVFETPIDIDGNGLPDLVGGRSSGSAGGFTWRPNRSGGAFGALQTAAATSGAWPFAWRDLDGDGDIDALARSIWGDSVAVLRNDGAGGFAPPEWQELTGLEDSGTWALGQFIGDDHPDLVRATYEKIYIPSEDTLSRSFVVHRGLGGGRFDSEPGPVSTVVAAPYSALRILDWNGDGWDDLVLPTGGDDASLRVALADGLGTFVPDHWSASGPFFGGFADFDLDGDGIRDLIQVGNSGVSLSLSSERAPVPASRTSPSVDWSDRPELVDLDGDGIRDLVGNRREFNGPFGAVAFVLCVQPGLPDGGFAPPLEWPVTPPEAHLLGTGDFDGDGDVDLLLGNHDSGAFQTWLNADDFAWHEARTSVSVPQDLEELRLADIDGDGRDELLVPSSSEDGGIVVWRNLASEPVVTDTLFADVYLDTWSTEDLDADGRDEIVAVGQGSGSSEFILAIYRLDDAGKPELVESTTFPNDVGVGSLVVGAPGASRGAGIFIEEYPFYDSPRKQLFEYHGDDQRLRYVGAVTSVESFSGVQFSDVTGDGTADLILDDGGTAHIFPIENGVLEAPLRVTLESRTWANLLLDDRNADGKPDLVRVDRFAAQVKVHWNLMDDTTARARLLAAASDWTVTLSWLDSPPGAAAAFQVERRRSGDTAWTTLADVPPIAAGDWTDTAVPAAGTWTYRLARRYGDSSLETLATTTVTVSPDPTRPRLLAPTPNPTRAPVAFAYELTRPGPLVLEVFDAAGRLVRRIDAGLRPAERATLTWDLRTDSGERVASGLYFARIAGGGAARRVVVLR